jgi:prolyl-tRNA synthetase
MVIKPWGYALWENIVRVLDGMFKDTGVENAYFPLFIPLHFLEKEAEHVEGFAKECAVVTHHRLEKHPEGGLRPAGALQEPLVVRPTSETIIGDSFARWITSWRDLPLLINQWSNIVRWEMRTRIFLRTSEFLWQEGHTVHAASEEAMERTKLMLDVYTKLAEDYLAMPVLRGRKTEAERFPGAVETFCIESMMQDRRALQAGTSHFLGQNFARASGIRFQSAEETEEYAWTTSWGASTRLIGGIIMIHGDDDGIVLPPRVASAHVVLLPIIRKDADKEPVTEAVNRLAAELRAGRFDGRPILVRVDDREIGGARNWEWIRKGIPLRVEIGPRDLAAGTVSVMRRDRDHRDRENIPIDQLAQVVPKLLTEIQASLFSRAKKFQTDNTVSIDDKETFHRFFTPENPDSPEIHGGFALSHWCGEGACEAAIKEELTVTIRCIPESESDETGGCIRCGKPSRGRVVFAKAY